MPAYNKLFGAVADMLPQPPASGGGGSGIAFGDVFIILGIGAVIGLILVTVFYLSKRKKNGAGAMADEEASSRRRRYRRRNPTLAETGGLPPIRSDGTPPPAS